MKEKNLSMFSAIYRILLSISIIASGLCLIYGCLTIYFTGDHTYSRQIVAETFSKISVPVYICLGLTALSIILNIILPDYNLKSVNKSNLKMKLEFLLNRKQINSECVNYTEICKERKHRRIINISQYCVITLSSVAFFIYALNSNNFDSSQINSSVIKAMYVLIPCLLIMFLTSITSEILKNKSIKREIELVSELPTVKTEAESDDSPERKSDRKTTIIRSVIILIGLGLLVFGFLSGGTADVLTKAVNICTECIGLG